MASNQIYSKICSHCGADFTAQKISTQYCSHKCSQRAYKLKKRKEKIVENDIQEKNKTLPLILQIKKSQQINTSVNNLSTLKQKEYLSMLDVAVLFSTSRSTIHRYCVSGKLKCIKMNRKIIIRRSDIDELFDSAPKYEIAHRKQKRSKKNNARAVEPQVSNEEILQTSEPITDLLTAEEAAIKNNVPWILFQGRRKYSRKHLEEHYQEANQYPHIMEWYFVEEIMAKYTMKKHSVYSLVSDNDVPRKNAKGKTIYSTSHIDELLKSRLCNYPSEIEIWYTKEDLHERYGLTPGYVSNFVLSNNIPKRRIGNRSEYSATHFDKALEERNPPTVYLRLEDAATHFNISFDNIRYLIKKHNIPKIQEEKYIRVQKLGLDLVINPPKIYLK